MNSQALIPNGAPDPARSSRYGFTVIELLIVIAVAIAIMGMSIPAYQYVRRKAAIDATRTLVSAVATAIDAYGQRVRPVYGPDRSDPTTPNSAKRRILVANLPMWDVDKDLIIDDNKGLDRDAALATLLPQISSKIALGSTIADLDMQGYAGFVGGSHASVPAQAFDASSGRIIDTWGTPLRFKAGVTAGSTSTSTSSAPGAYAGAWFGVWSCGPNTNDDGGNGDDVCSWK